MDPSRIALRLEIADMALDVDRAIPCTLIVNELVSNALKYAFPEGRAGCLGVELHVQPNAPYTLLVGDNGVGLPAHLDFRHTDTLGLGLVCDFVEQLRGTIVLDRIGGTAFRISFNGA